MKAQHIVTDKVFRFGRCEVDLARREVTTDGQQRPIERRAFNLLAYLLEQRHRVVSKDEPLDKVWPDECVTVGAIARALGRRSYGRHRSWRIAMKFECHGAALLGA